MRNLPFLAVLVVSPAAGLAAPKTHPFTVNDMLAMDRLADPQVSTDGAWVVFSRSRTDLEANKRRSDLWLVGVDGTGLRRLTAHPDGSDSGPLWAPDGKSIYFLSSRSGSSQVWKIARDGGEAATVTNLPVDVNAFVVSPDGKTFLVSLDVFADCTTLDCTKKRLDDKVATKASGHIYDHLFFRHWDTWSDNRRSHLFALSVSGGEPVDLMKGMDADCPSKPWGGLEELTFAPGGKAVVFTARAVGLDEAWSTNFDLFQASLDGKSTPKNLTAANKAWDTQPAFSPDGKTLAYLAMKEPGYEADRYRIILKSWPDLKERVLTEAWDRSPQSLLWSKDSKTLFVLAEHLGQVALFAIDVASGETRVVWSDGVLRAVSVAGDRLLFLREHLRSPAELFTVRTDGAGLMQVTSINGDKVAAAEMGEPSQFTFKGANDDLVHGYLVKPIRFDPGRRYPLAFLIHGGPQGSFGNDFHYRWNPQAYAGAGYAVAMIDFHGSTGYGQAFTDAIQGDWGGKPLVDLQKGLEYVLRENRWMDGDRVCALGASFGGYMINWIAGAWPNRFKCLVAHDGNLDERAAYFDTEELWFPERDHAGTPWSNPEGYERQNPVNLVKNWKTPILVVHGGKDFRVVETQGFSSFTAAQRRGVPSKLLYFPDENHWVLKPANSILWHNTVLGWLDQWTGNMRPK